LRNKFTTPQVIISSPQNGATITGGDVQVNAQVSNFIMVDKQGLASVAGEGHLHFYMDVTLIPSDLPDLPSRLMMTMTDSYRQSSSNDIGKGMDVKPGKMSGIICTTNP
jgi:hypothetical protein